VIEQAFLPMLFLLTSAALYVIATRGLGLPKATLGGALRAVLECAGLTLVLAAANVAAGFVLVLLLRRVTGSFLSLYVNTDLVILALALLQAVALQWWMAGEDPG
jgi:hypothetical protein